MPDRLIKLHSSNPCSPLALSSLEHSKLAHSHAQRRVPVSLTVSATPPYSTTRFSSALSVRKLFMSAQSSRTSIGKRFSKNNIFGFTVCCSTPSHHHSRPPSMSQVVGDDPASSGHRAVQDPPLAVEEVNQGGEEDLWRIETLVQEPSSPRSPSSPSSPSNWTGAWSHRDLDKGPTSIELVEVHGPPPRDRKLGTRRPFSSVFKVFVRPKSESPSPTSPVDPSFVAARRSMQADFARISFEPSELPLEWTPPENWFIEPSARPLSSSPKRSFSSTRDKLTFFDLNRQLSREVPRRTVTPGRQRATTGCSSSSSVGSAATLAEPWNSIELETGSERCWNQILTDSNEAARIGHLPTREEIEREQLRVRSRPSSYFSTRTVEIPDDQEDEFDVAVEAFDGSRSSPWKAPDSWDTRPSLE
ncbi:hypothetical protein T439DRAFT_360225 [Meredithblackwellia eburnea MCA 4105]